MRTYRRRQQFINDIGFSPSFMNKATAGLKKYQERYPNAVIRSGRLILIDAEAMYDWLKYREALDMNVTVPPFRREEYQ